MIIFEDIFTDNETFSDAYPTKMIDDLYYEAEGRLISIDNSIDDALIGGNASAEAEGDGGADDVKETAIDLVYVFKLMKYDLDKKGYQKHIQAYGKKILAKWQETERTEEEISAYKKKLATKVKDILAHFGDYDIYIHESYDDAGMLCLMNYREDGITPFFTYFAAGVRPVKV